MLQRTIAETGCQVSALGLGTVKFGRSSLVKYPREFVIPDDRTLSNLLALARDLGINLLDTAPAYGTSEERLGELLRGMRDRWVLCTKVGEEFHDDRSVYDFSPGATERSVERSLRRLRTDYLDIVLVHSDGNDREIITGSGVLDSLQRMKDRGTIRAFGVSTKSIDGGLLALERCDVVMATYNMAHREEEPVLELARATGRGVLVKKALDSGRLAVRSPHDLERALRFVYGHPGVTSVILGTIDAGHLQQNAELVMNLL